MPQGGVIVAVAGVMVAVLFTFALSGPLPPSEMGVIPGIAALHAAGPVAAWEQPVISPRMTAADCAARIRDGARAGEAAGSPRVWSWPRLARPGGLPR